MQASQSVKNENSIRAWKKQTPAEVNKFEINVHATTLSVKSLGQEIKEGENWKENIINTMYIQKVPGADWPGCLDECQTGWLMNLERALVFDLDQFLIV